MFSGTVVRVSVTALASATMRRTASPCASRPPSAAPAAVVVRDFNGGPDGVVKPENAGPNGTTASGNGSGCCTPVVPTSTAANSASVDADGSSGGDPKLKALCVTQRGAELTADSYSSTDSGGTAVVAPRYCNDPYCQLKEDASPVVVAVVPSQADGRSWKCEVCCKLFAQKHHLQTHLLCHSGVKRFECQAGDRIGAPHCDHSFLQVTHLKRHLVTHGGSCLPCAICGRRFAFPSDLSAHVAKHHPPTFAAYKHWCSRPSGTQTPV
ncbi:hypothetical protein MTO96_000232 [Rhipicephalus appendiculatus]